MSDDAVQNSGDEIDALYDKIVGQGDFDGPSGTQDEQIQEAPPAPQAPVQEFEFVWNGKQIKADREKYDKWAQQGYDYSQKMAEFNRRLQEFNSQKSEVDKLNETYGPVDKWVRENPHKWDALQKAIAGEQASGANPELLAELQALKQQVANASKFIETQQQKEERERIEKEDAALASEIQSIREKHSNLDWNSAAENGMSALELRVIEHAQANGINSFRAAFHDLLHDDLLKAAEAKGRESLTKERQTKQASGLLGKTQAPTKGLTKPTNIKSKSYDDLAREGLEELGISL